MAGASKVTKMCAIVPGMGLLNLWKCQHMHQEQEVYHCLYKDKLEKLAKDTLKKWLPELQHVLNGSKGEEESDGDSSNENSPKDKHMEPSSVKKLRALHMKICHEVHADAWANKTEEVQCHIKKEMMHEREEAAKVNGEEAKVGLE